MKAIGDYPITCISAFIKYYYFVRVIFSPLF